MQNAMRPRSEGVALRNDLQVQIESVWLCGEIPRSEWRRLPTNGWIGIGKRSMIECGLYSTPAVGIIFTGSVASSRYVFYYFSEEATFHNERGESSGSEHSKQRGVEEKGFE